MDYSQQPMYAFIWKLAKCMMHERCTLVHHNLGVTTYKCIVMVRVDVPSRHGLLVHVELDKVAVPLIPV